MQIYLCCPSSAEHLSEILFLAFSRSFTKGQLKKVTETELIDVFDQEEKIAMVVANPTEKLAEMIVKCLDRRGNKILILGRIPELTANYLRIKISRIPEYVKTATLCENAEIYNFSTSPAQIVYQNNPLLDIQSPIIRRACIRYDFMDEWNNLGYGAVRSDETIWALTQFVEGCSENVIATLDIEGKPDSLYAAFWLNDSSSLLWYNRSVGPIDTQEWRLVEKYFTSFGFPDSPCFPAVSEVPRGFDASVTMRLDCDEDISSANHLFDLYRDLDVPLSLALHSSLLQNANHASFVRDVVESGGSILTHSATHPSDWGGEYNEAKNQVLLSRSEILTAIGKHVRIDYAVSPFHQNPPYAISAMSDAGLYGFVGGIVKNDPEYLFARAGQVPYGPEGFISHSQQCMLHGDCMIEGDDPLCEYKKSFEISKKGRALFGYLDHPFSERYQYGWQSEIQRLRAHKDFIAHIKNSGSVKFFSENNALDWLRQKSLILIRPGNNGSFKIEVPGEIEDFRDYVVEFAGTQIPLNTFVI